MIEALPTPADAPEEFSGAVGRFEISCRGGRYNSAHERVRPDVRSALEGEGNIDALPDPKWPEFEGWRMRSILQRRANSDAVNGQIVGTRAYVRDLVPEMAGELTIPELSYTYFDPESESYMRAATSPIVVTITPIDGTLSSTSIDQSLDDEDVDGTEKHQGCTPVTPKI